MNSIIFFSPELLHTKKTFDGSLEQVIHKGQERLGLPRAFTINILEHCNIVPVVLNKNHRLRRGSNPER